MSTARMKAAVMVLLLTDQQKSSYVLEGTENTPFEKRLSAPGAYRLPSQSVVVDGKGVRRKIRYIKGCPIIDVEEQKKKGFEPSPINDVIWFENGKLVVVDDGADPGKFAYLKACEFNQSNENRPPAAKVKFLEFKPEKVSEDNLKRRSKAREAERLLEGLYSDGPNGYVFDENKIDFLSRLFGTMGLGSYSEKVDALMTISENDPEAFINSVANQTSEMKVEIAEAISFDIVSIDGEAASFKQSQKVILKFASSSNNNDSKVSELINHFLSKEGELDYKEMVIDITARREKMAGKVVA